MSNNDQPSSGSETLRQQVKQAGYEYPRVPAYAQTLPKEIGEGYRLLRVGEVIPVDAEFWAFTEWCPSTIVGKRVERDHCIQRALRKLEQRKNKSVFEVPEYLADGVVVKTPMGPMRVDPNGTWQGWFDAETGEASTSACFARVRDAECYPHQESVTSFGRRVFRLYLSEASALEEVGYRILHPEEIMRANDGVWQVWRNEKIGWTPTQHPGRPAVAAAVRRSVRMPSSCEPSAPADSIVEAAIVAQLKELVDDLRSANDQQDRAARAAPGALAPQAPQDATRKVSASLLEHQELTLEAAKSYDASFAERTGGMPVALPTTFEPARLKRFFDDYAEERKELQAQLEPGGAVVPDYVPMAEILRADVYKIGANAPKVPPETFYEFKIAGRNVKVGLVPTLNGQYTARWQSLRGGIATANVHNDPYAVHRAVVDIETNGAVEPPLMTSLRQAQALLAEEAEAAAKVLPGPGTHCEWGEP